eukprot:519235_1
MDKQFINITIKSTSSHFKQDVKLYCHRYSSPNALFQQIALKTNCSSVVKFAQNGKYFENGTLHSNGAVDGDIIYVEYSEAEDWTGQIFIRTQSSKSITRIVNSYETVKSLKKKIQKIAPKEQKLNFKGKPMDDKQKIWYYGINEGDTLDLISGYTGKYDDENQPLLRSYDKNGCCNKCLIL